MKKKKKKKTTKRKKKGEHKYTEKVLGKDARAALQGHDCAECKRFYEKSGLEGYGMQLCSRHRAKYKNQEILVQKCISYAYKYCTKFSSK